MVFYCAFLSIFAAEFNHLLKMSVTDYSINKGKQGEVKHFILIPRDFATPYFLEEDTFGHVPIIFLDEPSLGYSWLSVW